MEISYYRIIVYFTGMQKYKTGFLVGRFQPFHKGHLRLIKESFQYVESVIIGIGSVGINDQDNFLTYENRQKILNLIIEKEGWRDKVKKTVPLIDFHNDEKWLKNCLDLSGKLDVVIGNNEWTNRIFEKAGYPILRLGFYKRYLYEGVKIRKLIKSGKSWENRVPEYIVKTLNGYIAKKI